jgi:membrane protein DedA with SNARE-associated domain
MSGWIHHTADWLIANNLQTPLFILLIFFAFAEAAAFVGFVLPGETSLLIGGLSGFS